MTERQINVTIEGETARLAVADFRDLLSPREQRALANFEARCGVLGDRERRQAPLEIDQIAAPGDPGSDAAFIAKGHAAVYDRKSLDLGGFQEKIDPTAFNPVLDRHPLVHLNWDHDMRYALASTDSTDYLLELRSDPKGLHYYAKVAPVSYANDLRILMKGGVIKQASFAFTVAHDSWEIVNRDKPDEYVVRTIHEIGELFDVTITAQGAYPQTDSQVVRAYAFNYAQSRGLFATDTAETSDVELTHDEAREGVGLPKLDPDVDTEAVAPTAPEVETPEEPAVGASEGIPSHTGNGAGADDPSHTGNGAGGDVEAASNPLIRALRLHSRQELSYHRSLLEKTHEQDR
jgi:HK97 family phage prohead protease